MRIIKIGIMIRPSSVQCSSSTEEKLAVTLNLMLKTAASC